MAQREKLKAEQRNEVAEAFKMFDKNGDGQISVEELGEAMKQAGQEVSEEDLKEMIKAVDRNENGKVEYSEFEEMMACQMIGGSMTGDDMGYYFKKFDNDDDGYITGDELKTAMKTFGGKAFTTKEIDDMMKEVDINADGKVNYHEFVQMIRNKPL